VKRTRRGVQKTRSDLSVYVRAVSARAATALIVGTMPGIFWPSRQTPWKTRLARNSSSSQPRSADSGRSAAGTVLLRLSWARSVYGYQ
jgi:hypothetical protein